MRCCECNTWLPQLRKNRLVWICFGSLTNLHNQDPDFMPEMFYNIGPRSPVALKKKLERDLMMKLIMHAPKGCDSKTFFVVFYNLAQKLLA